jgi:endoglucanase
MRRLALAAILVLLAQTAAAATYRGVNIAGGEFGGPPGSYGKKYIYPDERQMRALRDTDMNVFRVPVRWERLQPETNRPLDEPEMARIDSVIRTAGALGASVIIDIHNYGRLKRQNIGTVAVPATAFCDLWARLAKRYRDKPHVIFGLMNEPIDIPSAEWASAAQAAVKAIRATGARNLVLVPGSHWSGAHSWLKPFNTVSNGDALAGFKDPANNMAFDFHQYFDSDSSGTHPECVTEAQALRRIEVASAWLRKVGGRGFLTEFGTGPSPQCLTALRAVLGAIEREPRWLGWTAWASSAWFGADYAFNLSPFANPRPPQLRILEQFLTAQPRP